MVEEQWRYCREGPRPNTLESPEAVRGSVSHNDRMSLDMKRVRIPRPLGIPPCSSMMDRETSRGDGGAQQGQYLAVRTTGGPGSETNKLTYPVQHALASVTKGSLMSTYGPGLCLR